MTAQEDNAVLEVLVRAHKAGFADYGRAILFRSGSDFDRAPDLANDYMNIEFNNNSTDLVDPSVANLFTVGNPIVQAVCFTTHTDCGQLDPRMGAGRCTAEQHVVRGCLWHPPLVDSYTHSHRYPPLPPPIQVEAHLYGFPLGGPFVPTGPCTTFAVCACPLLSYHLYFKLFFSLPAHVNTEV